MSIFDVIALGFVATGLILAVIAIRQMRWCYDFDVRFFVGAFVCADIALFFTNVWCGIAFAVAPAVAWMFGCILAKFLPDGRVYDDTRVFYSKQFCAVCGKEDYNQCDKCGEFVCSSCVDKHSQVAHRNFLTRLFSRFLRRRKK